MYVIKGSGCCLTVKRCDQCQQLEAGHSLMYGNGENSSEASILDTLQIQSLGLSRINK